MLGLETVLAALKIEDVGGGVAFTYEGWPEGKHIRFEADDFVPPPGWTAVPYTPTQEEMIFSGWRKYTRI